MNKIDEMRIDAYVVLVRAERININEVPEKYKETVEIKVAEKILELLGGE